MLVDGYARYSTDNQSDLSIEQQYNEILKYCNNNGHTLVNFYHDEAMSGSIEYRPNLQKMITNCVEYKECKSIIVWKFDRMFRNSYDSAIYKKKLKDVDIKVISITQNIPDGPERNYIRTFDRSYGRVLYCKC